MDTNNIIRDILLLELYEKKLGKSILVDQQQVRKHCEYLHLEIVDMAYIETSDICYQHIALRDTYNLEEVLMNNYPTILRCLNLCKGKLSICGKLEALWKPQNYTPVVYLYFHSITVLEAKMLLQECLILLDDHLCYINNESIRILEGDITFIFSTTICKNIEELLINREHILEKQLWNPKDGYVTTLATSICIGLRGYPLDITLPCRKLNYYNEIGFNIIFPGLRLSDSINTPNKIERYINHEIRNIYEDGKLELPDCVLSFSSELVIPVNITNNPYPNNPISLPLHKLEQQFIGKFNGHPKQNKRCLTQLMNKINVKMYCPISRPIINITKYFEEKYKPYIIGISDDRYVALSNCIRKFNLPKELFRLLCEYWLTAEVMLIKDRLFSVSD